MKLSSFVFTFVLFIICNLGFSQEVVNPKTPDTLSPWTKKNQLGFDISEIAFVNWSAGGTSSVSGLVKGDFSRIYAIDDADFSDDDELMDYMDELASTDAMEFEVSEWNEEGSEDIGGGFSIDEINKL